MKNAIVILCIISFPFLNYAQKGFNEDLEASFTALIVTDIDTSMAWYANVLGFKMMNIVLAEDRGFKQSNLKRGNLAIELIELDQAVSLDNAIPNYNAKLRVIGFFKIGFSVSHFDKWIDHLTNEKAEFYGDIVTDDSSGKRMAIITDPDGNRIQLFEK